jgi:hypothetical protein
MCANYLISENENEIEFQEPFQQPLFVKFDNKELAIYNYEITDPNQDKWNYRGRPKRNIEFNLELTQMKAFSLYFELEEVYNDLVYYETLKSKKDKDKYLHKMVKSYGGFSMINKAKRFNKEPLYFPVGKMFSIGAHNCKLLDIEFKQLISISYGIYTYWTIRGEVDITD